MPAEQVVRTKQEQRSDGTRQALLDAAVASLVELGFARTASWLNSARGISLRAVRGVAEPEPADPAEPADPVPGVGDGVGSGAG